MLVIVVVHITIWYSISYALCLQSLEYYKDLAENIKR
jgi:hypothetical protein